MATCSRAAIARDSFVAADCRPALSTTTMCAFMRANVGGRPQRFLHAPGPRAGRRRSAASGGVAGGAVDRHPEDQSHRARPVRVRILAVVLPRQARVEFTAHVLVYGGDPA